VICGKRLEVAGVREVRAQVECDGHFDGVPEPSRVRADRVERCRTFGDGSVDVGEQPLAVRALNLQPAFRVKAMNRLIYADLLSATAFPSACGTAAGINVGGAARHRETGEEGARGI